MLIGKNLHSRYAPYPRNSKLSMSGHGYESYHKAHIDQVSYLQRDLIKPYYGMDVERAFCRIDHLISMLEYFPPSSFRGQPATQAEWEISRSQRSQGIMCSGTSSSGSSPPGTRRSLRPWNKTTR